MEHDSEFEDSYDDERVLRGAILHESLQDVPKRPILALSASMSIADAVAAMVERHVGAALITKDGKLVGIFTERDVLGRVVSKGVDIHKTSVDAVMTEDPETLPETASVAYALRKMSTEGYRHIPMVDRQGRPAGIVAVRDIVRWLVNLFPESVNNLPPDPSLEVGVEREGA